MALDLHKTARQVSRMGDSLAASSNDRRLRVQAALHLVRDPLQGGKRTVAKIEALAALGAPPRKVGWLTAGLPFDWQQRGLAQAIPAPPAPHEYIAIGADGSQVDLDRHGPAHCFVINIGGMQVRYGRQPAATSWTEPHLFSAPEEMNLSDGDGVKETPIDASLLAVKRQVMEARALADRVAALPAGLPALALLDGTLVLWTLSGGDRSEGRYGDHVRRVFLQDGLLAALDSLRTQRQTPALPFASYISNPRSPEVVNLLRLIACPHEALETSGCARICGRGGVGKRECDAVAQSLMDRDLFEGLLAPGQRSAVFASQSNIVVSDYGTHGVRFCYLNVGDEIARLEMPAWVAQDAASLDLLHALVLDQCAKGRGYPLVLQEAHEQAVVTAADRRSFWTLVAQSLAQRGIPVGGSEKARSKRVRAL